MAGGGLVVWWLANRLVERPDRGFVARVAIASFVLRCGWSFFQHVIYPSAWRLVAADAMARYGWGRQEAALWREGLAQPALPATLAEAHSRAINLFTTSMIYVFGESAMLPEAITITLNVTIVIAIYLICRHIGTTRGSARAAVVFAAFLPSLMLWSTQNLKDPVTGAAIAWGTLAYMKVGERAHGGYLLLLVVANFLALVYRPYVGILFIAGQGLAWASTVKLPQNALGTVTRIAMFAIMTPLVLYIGTQEMQHTYGEDFGLEWAVDQYESFRQSGMAREGHHGSHYAIPLTASTPAQAILQLPIRVLLLLLSPIPLFPGSTIRLMMYPEMWFMYLYIVPRFVGGFREAWRKNRLALVTILLLLAPVIVSYALKTSVSGEAVRMRSQFMAVLLIFAGIGHGLRSQSAEEPQPAPREVPRLHSAD